MSYSVDCHRALSVELIVTVAGLKSAIAYIFTLVVNEVVVYHPEFRESCRVLDDRYNVGLWEARSSLDLSQSNL